MGQLIYASTHEVGFDDRVLAHLQLVITGKLRRGEAFNFSWTNTPEQGSGRTTLWLHPTIPVVFTFAGSRMPAINRQWVEDLMASANSAGGLRVIAEPPATLPVATSSTETPAQTARVVPIPKAPSSR